MKIVFMGTPVFAVPTLQMLLDANYEVCEVVTQPDRPNGRGKKVTMPPVKELAIANNIPVSQPERIKGDEAFYNHIKALNPDLIIVVAFGQILPESILEIPRLGCINVHGSLLPAYRGSAPIQWSVIQGEKTTGVTVMYMDKGMDTGDMLLKREMPLADTETAGSLHDRMMYVGAEALKEALPGIIAQTIVREKQDDAVATYAPMLQKTLGELDFSKPATTLDALVRGLNPWPIAYTYYEDQTMKVWETKVVAQDEEVAAGTIVAVTQEGIFVQTGKGQLCITEIQMPNKRRMPVSEYIKGNSVIQGQLLGR